MQSLVVVVSLQLAFQVRIVENLARILPDLAGVVVRDVPQFRCAPPMPVKRFIYLTVVEDCRSVGSVDVHRETLP